MKYFLIFFLFSLELSLFGGNLSGIELTESEKFIFENRKSITKLNIKFENLKEDIDGIKSILDSMSEKVSSPKKSKSYDDLKNRISKLEKRVEKIEHENKKRFLKIEKSIQKLITMLSNKQNVKDIKKKIDKKDKKKIKILPVKTIYKNALKAFKAKKYQLSRNHFLDLVDKKYKLAESYFYIAETLFYQKRYKEAIHYYKKSVDKDDDSPYLAKLLLHAGISFKNIGDKVGAKRFFNSLIGAYPSSTEAKQAKIYLKKL